MNDNEMPFNVGLEDLEEIIAFSSSFIDICERHIS